MKIKIVQFFCLFLSLFLLNRIVDAKVSGSTSVLWQTNSLGDDVHIIDIETRKVIKQLVVGQNPQGIAAPDPADVVFITIENKPHSYGELLWVDPINYKILHRMMVGPKPNQLATTPDGHWVYVPCQDGYYWVIDAKNKTLVKKIKTGGRPHNTTASSDGRFMYLSPIAKSKSVFVVDILANHKLIGMIPFSNRTRPPALSADNKFLYQHVDNLNGFEVADASSRSLIATIKHSKQFDWFNKLRRNRLFETLQMNNWFDRDGFQYCHGLAIRPDQKEIWSNCGNWITIHSLVKQNYPEIAIIPLQGVPYWITFSPDGKYSFVALKNANTVAMIDTNTKRIISHIKVGEAPKRNLAFALTANTKPKAGTY